MIITVQSNVSHITTTTVTAGLSRSLRQLIGPGRRWSYASVSKNTGIDLRTLKAYVQGTACPNLVRYKRLLAVLGPEVGEELNRLQGMLPRRGESPPEALDLLALRAELTRAVSIIRRVLAMPPAPVEPSVGTTAAPLADSVPTRPEYKRALKPLRIDQRAIAERLGFRLTQMIGDGRKWSLTDVAGATGIDSRTLRTYRDGTACPNLARYMRLMQILGPESGYELALMLGWQPRFRVASKLSGASLRALDTAAMEACAAVDELLTTHGQRLVSPADNATEATAIDLTRRQNKAPPSRLTH